MAFIMDKPFLSGVSLCFWLDTSSESKSLFGDTNMLGVSSAGEEKVLMASLVDFGVEEREELSSSS